MDHAGHEAADLVEQYWTVLPSHCVGKHPLDSGRSQPDGQRPSGGDLLTPRPPLRRMRWARGAQKPGDPVVKPAAPVVDEFAGTPGKK